MSPLAVVRACLRFVLVVAILTPAAARACSCAPTGTPQQELAQSTEVFRGRVLQIEERETFDLAIFAATTVWKGSPDPLRVAETGSSSTLCGFPFVVGQEYVVYGAPVASCGRTKLVSAAAADLAALGPGRPANAATLATLARHSHLAGTWYNPQRSGEGFVVEIHANDRGSVIWFGYDQAEPDRQAWMFGTGAFQGNTLVIETLIRPVGGGFGYFYQADQVRYPVWGSLRLSLLPSGSGIAYFFPAAVPPLAPVVSFGIERLTRPPALPVPAAAR